MNKFFGSLVVGFVALGLTSVAHSSTFSQFFASGGPIDGAPFIGYDTGVLNSPSYVGNIGFTQNTTATRAYYMPFFVAEAVTFSSVVTWNQGAADNGKTYRIAIYANDGTAGPGTLIIDVGQVTLTGAAATRTLSATINLQAYAGQWVWVMFHANEAAAMEGMDVAGSANLPQTSAWFGSFNALTTAFQNYSPFRYVNTAYGAAAATAVTPTASDASAPIFALVK